MISNVYSKSYLQSSPEVHKISQTMIFDRLLPLLATASDKKEPLDVLELNFSSTMDFIIAFIFGLQNCSNFLLDAETRKHWLAVYASRRPYRFWAGEAPGLHTFFRKLGIYLVPKWVDEASSEIEAWTLEKCKAAQKALTTPPSPSQTQHTEPIVYAQLTSAFPPRIPSSKDTQPDLRTATELLDHLAAGHETSGITLTYLMHELSLHPQLQHQLREECLTLSPPLTYPPTPNGTTPPLPSARAISALPLLHALLLETLRLHPPIPGPQPRTSPPTGTTLASHPIPPSVRVSSQAYTLHRNPLVFPSPHTWSPTRWLTATAAQNAEMHRWFWAFGSGGRMCVGSHFAMQEMKLIVAAVYTNFATRVVDDGGVEQGDGYTVGPRGGRLVLGFERVER